VTERIQSVDRAIDLLLAVAAAGPADAGVPALAKACGLNRATAWRLLKTLQARRMVTVAVTALLLAGASACAGVPASSPVQVLRQVGAGDEVAPPPAPVAGANVLDIVRGFVTASSSSSDRHGASRRFLTPEAAQAVFRADWSKLPGYAGVEAQDGRYVLYRISKVIDVETVDPAQRKSLVQQLTPVLGQEALAARVSSLKQKADVKIDEKKLEKAG